VIGESAWLNALPPFLLAAVVCIVAVPLSIRLAPRIGAVAHPDEERHLHAAPTPRLGGLAMLLGFVVAVVVFGGQVQSRWPILAVAGVVTLAMAVDDIVDLVWWQKLIVVVGAGVAFYVLGISITSVDLPGGHLVQLGLLALPVTVLWVSGMQVSVNFMDGADGVAAGVVAIVALVAMLAAINRIIVPGDLQSGVVVLSAALMGVCLGFLVFNLPPARTFMGDTGSHFLGVVIAAITIVGIAKVTVGLSILVPLIALGLPISDTAWAIVRRGRAGVSPTTPDARHLHHRLQARGMTPMETALTFYFATGVLGCLGLALFGHRKILDFALGLCALGVVAVFWRNHRRLQRTRREAAVLSTQADAGMEVSGHGALLESLRHPRDLD
jgi:UDP-GlcNAc:undecaprenyl-phosphate GlcNAc-1-phosphate transferase